MSQSWAVKELVFNRHPVQPPPLRRDRFVAGLKMMSADSGSAAPKEYRKESVVPRESTSVIKLIIVSLMVFLSLEGKGERVPDNPLS